MSETSPAPEPGERQQLSVRRAPKLGAFLVVGGALGFLVTLIVTTAVPRNPESGVGLGTLVAYFSIYGITAGVLIGALTGILLDRRSRKRARTMEAVHEVVDPAPLEGELEDDADFAHPDDHADDRANGDADAAGERR